jgi:hypothetical protein
MIMVSLKKLKTFYFNFEIEYPPIQKCAKLLLVPVLVGVKLMFAKLFLRLRESPFMYLWCGDAGPLRLLHRLWLVVI